MFDLPYEYEAREYIVSHRLADLVDQYSLLSYLYGEQIGLKDDEIIVPNEAHLLVAKGAALASLDSKEFTTRELKEKIEDLEGASYSETKPLDPLFINEEDYNTFKARHEKNKVKKGELEKATGDVFVGIDAGSTTTKLVAIDKVLTKRF